MKKCYLIIVLLGVLGCQNDDENTIVPTAENHCYVTKYGKITFESNVLWSTELIYDNDNRITKRLNYGNTLSGSTGQSNFALASTDQITYNANHTVTIQNRPDISNVFYYTMDIRYPYKREYIRVSDEGYVSKWIENINYDAQMRILETHYFYDNQEGIPQLDENTDATYIYDNNSNLIKVTQVEQNGVTRLTTITEFSNYDTHKNPFITISVPFIENRSVAFSKNNYQTKKVMQYYGDDLANASFSETSTSGFTYNEHDYPLFAEYRCQ